MSSRGRLITLETFIIDTFTRVDEDGIERAVDRPDEIGGGGSYGIMGARLFLPASRLGMIVDYTASSLPKAMRAQLETFGNEMWYFRERTDGHPTSKSVNRYTGELRVFEYLSPARYLHPTDILETSWINRPPSAIHLISDHRRLDHFVQDMDTVRRSVGQEWDPVIVWEPEPYDNVPERLSLFKALTPNIHVLTPNHTEAFSLLSLKPRNNDWKAIKTTIETAAIKLLELNPRVGVVIRCGQYGACFAHAGSEVISWVPPYWHEGVPGWSEKVVDPTGAGNAFCGALLAGLTEGKDLYESVLWGTVAASFIIEQHGLPALHVSDPTSCPFSHSSQGPVETWNGDTVHGRLERLRLRMQHE